LTNLAFDIGESPLDHQDLEIETTQPQIEIPPLSQSSSIPSIEQKSDVKAELDSLLRSLQLRTPQPPEMEASSISGNLATIAATQPIALTQQLLQELNTSRTELQVIHQQNQAQVEAIDVNILQIKQLKFRTQQLATHSKNQLEQAVAMLSSIDQIRTEIISSLDRFGGYEKVYGMLAQLETTRQALVLAHDQVTTGQVAFYDSLKAIQLDVIARSDESEQQLHKYQSSIQSLSENISSDRLQITKMGVDLSAKFVDLDRLNTQLTNTHTRIVDTDQTMQARIVEIDRGFDELLASVQTEKEQFYALTAETIEKAELIQSQLIEIVKQINDDRQSNSILKTEIGLVSSKIKVELDRQLNDLEMRQRELVSICNSFQSRYKQQTLTIRKISTWLWILSFAIAGMFGLLVRLLFTQSR
jgi:hypothetical protein